MSETTPETPPVPQDPPTEAQRLAQWATANPDALPERFNGDPEAFVKAYNEMHGLTTKVSQENAALRKAQEAAASPVVTSVATPAVSAEAPAPDPASNPEGLPATLDVKAPEDLPAGFDWDSVGREISTNGSISDETVKAITEKYGIPDAVVRQYEKGFAAQQRLAVAEAAKTVGGEENLQSLLSWASKNLTDAERERVNIALQTDPTTTLMGLQARMQSSDPTAGEPRRVGTTTGPVTGVRPFQTKAELTRATTDPRFSQNSDPQFREEVLARMRITPWLGAARP